MTKGAQAGEAEGARSKRVVEKVAYQSFGDVHSVFDGPGKFGGEMDLFADLSSGVCYREPEVLRSWRRARFGTSTAFVRQWAWPSA